MRGGGAPTGAHEHARVELWLGPIGLRKRHAGRANPGSQVRGLGRSVRKSGSGQAPQGCADATQGVRILQAPRPEVPTSSRAVRALARLLRAAHIPRRARIM